MIGGSSESALRISFEDDSSAFPLCQIHHCVSAQLQFQGSNALSATQQTIPAVGA